MRLLRHVIGRGWLLWNRHAAAVFVLPERQRQKAAVNTG